MAFVAVYDANVLYPSVLRDVLLRVAAALGNRHVDATRPPAPGDRPSA